jgi:hypothetical protein
MLRLHDAPEVAASLVIGVALVALGSVVSLYDQEWTWLIATGGMAVLLVMWSYAVAWFSRRMLRPRPTWECPHCRYDRRGLAAGAACPECGRL